MTEAVVPHSCGCMRVFVEEAARETSGGSLGEEGLGDSQGALSQRSESERGCEPRLSIVGVGVIESGTVVKQPRYLLLI